MVKHSLITMKDWLQIRILQFTIVPHLQSFRRNPIGAIDLHFATFAFPFDLIHHDAPPAVHFRATAGKLLAGATPRAVNCICRLN